MYEGPFKYIFFDMDGVLVLSESLHYAAWLNTLSQLNLPQDWFHCEDIIGLSDINIATDLIQKFNLSDSPQNIYDCKKQQLIKNVTKGFKVHQGRNQLLDWVTTNSKAALVSSASRQEIDAIIAHEQIKHYFNFIIGAEDVKAHKPDPASYLLALEKAGVQPNEALVIEDSEVGITAALRANVPVIGLYTDAIIPDDLKQKVTFFNDFLAVEQWLHTRV